MRFCPFGLNVDTFIPVGNREKKGAKRIFQYNFAPDKLFQNEKKETYQGSNFFAQ